MTMVFAVRERGETMADLIDRRAAIDAIRIIKAWIEQKDADGCTGCVYYDNEEWLMPCVKCKRNCKDYWRMGHNEE